MAAGITAFCGGLCRAAPLRLHALRLLDESPDELELLQYSRGILLRNQPLPVLGNSGRSASGDGRQTRRRRSRREAERTEGPG